MNTRVSFLIVVLLASFVLFTDFTSSRKQSATPLTPNPSQQKLDEKSKEFLMEQYKSAVEEIRIRIEKEHHLYLLKFTYVGAVLTAFFKFFKREAKNYADPKRLVCLWATVAIAAIMDVRLSFNTMIISDLGAWVRNAENYLYGESSDLGWEHYFHQNSRLFVEPVLALQFIDRELLTWVLFAVVLAYSIPTLTDQSDLSLWLNVGRPASCLCTLVAAFTGLRSVYWWTHFLVAGVCILLIWFWPWPRLSPMEAAADQPPAELQ